MDEKEGVSKARAGVLSDFDFDLWEKLARLDPDEFERQRKLALGRFVESRVTDREEVAALCEQIESMRDPNGEPMENLQWLVDEMLKALNQLVESHGEQVRQVSSLLH